MPTRDWWHLKPEVRSRLAAAQLSPSTDRVDRTIVSARERAVAQVGSWWPTGPDASIGVAKDKIRAASSALDDDAKLRFVDEAIVVACHEWANERVRRAAPGLLVEIAERTGELARDAGLGEDEQRSLRRSARRALRERLAMIDTHLAPGAEVGPSELDALVAEALDRVRARLSVRSVRAGVLDTAPSYPDWLVAVVLEIVDHPGFELERFAGGVDELFKREARRSQLPRGSLLDDRIASELDELYGVLRSDGIGERTRARVLHFGRTRGRRLDLVGITAHVLDRSERSVERAWTFRDKLALGPKRLDSPEAYAWRVVSQQLSRWTAEYSTAAAPLSSVAGLELENLAGRAAPSTTEAWFEAASRVARRVVVLLGRGGIELAGAIDDARQIRLHPKQWVAFWEVFDLAVVAKRLEVELVAPPPDGADPRSELDGLARLRAVVADAGGPELKLLVHKSRSLLDSAWRAQYPSPSRLPDSDDPAEAADYQAVRRRTIGQSTSSNPVIAGGVARLLSGLHHDISQVFTEETPP